MKIVIEILKLVLPYVGDIIHAVRGKGGKVADKKASSKADSTTVTKPI